MTGRQVAISGHGTVCDELAVLLRRLQVVKVVVGAMDSILCRGD